jgi:NadR type nicotinamide-nucleotide adenylyltransferase
MPLKKIVIIGPESTGKSTLCQGLAAHFSGGVAPGQVATDWVPEYAREYLLAHGMDYTYDDLLTIARGQLALEDAKAAALIRHAGSADAVLFIDTDLYVMRVWSEFVFGRCDPWILGQIGSRKYDGYLLCRTDLPWVKDELREYPDLITRDKLFHIYRDLLVDQPTLWAEVGGQDGERLENGIAAVRRLLH